MSIERMKIPPVALGTWAWGDTGDQGSGYFGSTMTRAGLDELAQKALSAGLTMWDTAVVYGMGRAEAVLGDVLARYSRSDYQLSTKFTPQAASSTSDRAVAEMLEQSLTRLGTTYVDLYWIHNPADVNKWTPHLIPLLESGKVRHVGVSNHNLGEVERANSILEASGFHIEAVQNHFSLLYRDPEEAGLLEYCREQGIPFFAYMVLEQGALSGQYGPGRGMPEGTNRAKAYNGMLHQLEELTSKLATVGQAAGANPAEVATAWALSKGATPIIGVTRPAHVEGIVRALRMELSTEDAAELEAVANTIDVSTRGWWEKDLRA